MPVIYLDHNATSPLLEEVARVMQPWFFVPANAGSVHRAGQRAAAALEEARVKVASAVGAKPERVVFTSGATEANNLALHGAVAEVGGPIGCARSEHPSVWRTAERLGWRELDVGADGVVQMIAAPILSVQAVNHETGVVQPSPAGQGRFVHVDATQALGRVPVSVDGLHALTLSSHKLGGPPGIGALILGEQEDFPALHFGGGQERGRRAGTVPVALAVGFAEACELAVRERVARVVRWKEQRAVLEAAVLAAGGTVIGGTTERAANTLCASFSGLLGESVVQSMDLRGVCVSSGAACASGSTKPSDVLSAMGHPEPRSGVRWSLGPRTTDDEVAAAADVVVPVVEGLRDSANWL